MIHQNIFFVGMTHRVDFHNKKCENALNNASKNGWKIFREMIGISNGFQKIPPVILLERKLKPHKMLFILIGKRLIECSIKTSIAGFLNKMEIFLNFVGLSLFKNGHLKLKFLLFRNASGTKKSWSLFLFKSLNSSLYNTSEFQISKQSAFLKPFSEPF